MNPAMVLAVLSPAARAAYDRDRRAWNASLGPVRTPRLAAPHEDLWDTPDASQQDGDKAKAPWRSTRGPVSVAGGHREE